MAQKQGAVAGAECNTVIELKQITFADAEYAGKRKQTRKELFLIEMDQVVPWKGLVTMIEPGLSALHF